MKKSKRPNTDKKNYFKSLNKIYVFSVISILVVILLVAILAFYSFMVAGVITIDDLKTGGWWIILVFILSSVAIGAIITFLISRLVLKPTNKIMYGIDKLSRGDYDVNIEEKYARIYPLTEKFNSLAKELKDTEILRSDFINNFSHEFKTPIVSMRGLIELLKKGNLPEEKRLTYLSIIEEEADRLAQMSTNVLTLTNVENQNTLKNVTQFNVSEQIRTCILLLEKKWEKKDLSFKLDFDEYFIFANEDLLKEVWINLLDNAVKFAYQHSEIEVKIKEKDGGTEISVANHGEEISDEDKGKIFNKFYQKNKGVGAEGNGIGLSIVKHVVDIHKGNVSVESENGVTVFTVFLPQEKL